MLCNRPARAHPPIVEGRKWTFVAARISAASASVIQSVAAGIDQSVVFDAPAVDDFSAFFDVPLSAPDDRSDADRSFLDDVAADPVSDATADSLFDPSSEPPASASGFAEPAPTVDRRSFFAQPEPL